MIKARDAKHESLKIKIRRAKKMGTERSVGERLCMSVCSVCGARVREREEKGLLYYCGIEAYTLLLGKREVYIATALKQGRVIIPSLCLSYGIQ